jgi:hypothetical protein
MQWPEIQTTHPEQWVVLEALDSHTEGAVFVVDDAAMVQACPDGAAAFESYRRLHRLHPERELLFVHTSRADLRFEERRWVGVRTGS